MYLITYIDIDKHRKKIICSSEEEMLDYLNYCLEHNLHCNLYQLTELH